MKSMYHTDRLWAVAECFVIFYKMQAHRGLCDWRLLYRGLYYIVSYTY